jgi:hypothetical protein
LGIKSQPALLGEDPIYTVTVNLASFDPWHKDMPVVTAAVSNWIQRDRSRRVTIIGLVKQQQLHSSIALRENAEIHAARIHGRTDRKTFTWRNYCVHPPCSQFSFLCSWAPIRCCSQSEKTLKNQLGQHFVSATPAPIAFRATWQVHPEELARREPMALARARRDLTELIGQISMG